MNPPNEGLLNPPDSTVCQAMDSGNSGQYAPLSSQQVLTVGHPEVNWLWHGYVAPGSVTLLTSQWKCGKTTLASVLLARLESGGTLAGLPVRPGRVVVISEEGHDLWAARIRRQSIGDHVAWLCRPFRGRPSVDEWHQLIDSLARRRRREGLDLVVIDPLAAFLPARTENDAAIMLDALLPLQRLTEEGAAVLVLHHPKKGDALPGHAARGSGALTGSADVIIEMGWHGRPGDDDRRRRLQAFSRHADTPPRLVIELTEDGKDYLSRGDFTPDEFPSGWEVLRGVLEDAHQKLTRRRILADWPQDHPKPDEATLWRWLDRVVANGQVQRDGTGRKNCPYRFWLTGQEEKWKNDPLHIEDLEPMSERDFVSAAANVMRYNKRLQRKEQRRKERRERERATEKAAEEALPQEPAGDEPRCFPFGEEAKWIR